MYLLFESILAFLCVLELKKNTKWVKKKSFQMKNKYAKYLSLQDLSSIFDRCLKNEWFHFKVTFVGVLSYLHSCFYMTVDLCAQINY